MAGLPIETFLARDIRDLEACHILIRPLQCMLPWAALEGHLEDTAGAECNSSSINQW